jgi:geranylgeranyl pyrophosphate synthase
VLTGDYLFARAAMLAAEVDHLLLMKHFSETLAIIVNGELAQMFTSRGILSRDNYYKRIYAKTASLFEMTARSAALISPVDDSVVESMRSFGYKTGMAFQIVDDVLDFTGEQSAVGKPLGSDLLNGLVTLPAIFYAEAHPDDPDVLSLPQGGWTNSDNMARLIDKIRASRAVSQSLDEASGLVESAIEHLDVLQPGTERDALESLARYIVGRRT